MRLSQPARVKAASALLALSVLVSVVPMFLQANVTAKILPSQITLDGKRLNALRQALPAQAVVGYVSDEGGDDGGLWDFYLAQYFLAPVLLEKGSGRELVVGNFRKPVADAEWLASRDLILVQDFGDGVMLFRRK